jgi:hypothetical protein
MSTSHYAGFPNVLSSDGRAHNSSLNDITRIQRDKAGPRSAVFLEIPGKKYAFGFITPQPK